MATFYKGIGVGTFLWATDLRISGIVPRAPGATADLKNLMDHVARATTFSPYISLTRSYGIAEDYAHSTRNIWPTSSVPAYVYEITIDDDDAGVTLIDPVKFVAETLTDPLASNSYQHNGDQSFLSEVVDPAGTVISSSVRYPRGLPGVKKNPSLSIELETIARALRDAEILIHGSCPAKCVVRRHDVY